MEGTIQQMQNLTLGGQLVDDQRDKLIDQQQDVGESLVLDNIDQAIQNALNYPQQRLTVIRLEMEIEKFSQDSSINLYSFDTKLTNYERMLAHKIAQYWGMQTRSAEYTDSGPGAVQAVKPSQLKLPQVKLANLKPITSDPTQMSNPKVLVRKQPMVSSQQFMRPNPMNINQNFMQKPPPPQFDYRSVQEREEDYNRARERIFLQEEQKLNAVQNQQLDNEAQSQQSNNSQGNIVYLQQGNNLDPSQQSKLRNTNQPDIIDAQTQEHLNSQIGNNKNLSSGSLNYQGQQQGMTMINSSGNISQSSSQAGNNNRKNRKAVFRNKEQELQDPDYRRGIERFMPRFAPGYEDQQKQGFYVMPTYGSEFPTLAAPQTFIPYNPQFMPQQQGLHPQQQNPMMTHQAPMHPQAQGYMPNPQMIQQQQLQVQHQNPHQTHGPQHPMQQPQLVPMQQIHMYPQAVQGTQGQQQQQFPQQAFIQPFHMYQFQHGAQQQLPQMPQPQFQQAHSVSGSTDSQQPNPQIAHSQMQPQMYYYPPQNAQMPPGLQFVNPQQFPVDFNMMQQNPHLAQQFMIAQQQPGSRGGSMSGKNSNHGSSHRSGYKPNQPHPRNNTQYQQFSQQQQHGYQQRLQDQSNDRGSENRHKNGDKQPNKYAVEQIQNTQSNNNKANLDGKGAVDVKLQAYQEKLQNSQQQDSTQN